MGRNPVINANVLACSVALYARAWVEIFSTAGEQQQSAAVALYARAWVEIRLWRQDADVGFVALYARAWVEILIQGRTLAGVLCRPLREGVGRNRSMNLTSCVIPGRPLREGVGRNYGYLQKTGGDRVALYARAWVEIPSSALGYPG